MINIPSNIVLPIAYHITALIRENSWEFFWWFLTHLGEGRGRTSCNFRTYSRRAPGKLLGCCIGSSNWEHWIWSQCSCCVSISSLGSSVDGPWPPSWACSCSWTSQWRPKDKLLNTCPNKKPAPLGLSLNPTATSSGSLHSKSDPAPFSGTSCTLGIFLISSRVLIDGDSPPCRQKISSSTTAVIGM